MTAALLAFVLMLPAAGPPDSPVWPVGNRYDEPYVFAPNVWEREEAARWFLRQTRGLESGPPTFDRFRPCACPCHRRGHR